MTSRLPIIAGLTVASVAASVYGYVKLTKYFDNLAENKKKHTLWIETDLEPDDVLGINILQKKKYSINTIVSGEGDTDKKIFRAVKYFGNACDKFIIGEGSDKEFKENVTEDTSKIKCEIHKSENYENLLREYLNKGYTKMLIIKPPRELFKLYCEKPEEVKEMLKGVTCYMYGSFNLRCLKADKNKLESFLASFGKLYIYETYHATGSENTLNASNYNNFSKMAELCPNLKELMEEWDNFNMQDCVDTCNKLTGRTDVELKSLDELVSSGQFTGALSDRQSI